MGHRKIETVEVRSKHKDFAGGVGKTRFVTPDEAKMLYGINRAEPVEQPEYLHREMLTQQRHRKGK